MKKISKKIWGLMWVAGLLVIAAFTYLVVLPEYKAGVYIKQVHSSANTLRSSYMKLVDSTQRTLISDPTSQTETLTKEVESISTLVRENRISLAHFTSIAKDFQPLPYTGFTPRAEEASVLQNRAMTFAEQSNEAFTKYSELIEFIKHYDAITKDAQQHANEFNASLDLNLYAGQHGRFYAIAQQIRSDVQAFETAQTPHETTAFKNASVQSFKELANGFETVARGLENPVDEVIYSGARQIEAADHAINVTNQGVYAKDISSSRTIKSIQELREKLDLILP